MRGATITVDPSSGAPALKVPVFARSRGAELGLRIERKNFTASLVGFWLDLASELVFVGDGGTASWTHARFKGVAVGEDFIPGATPFVLGGGISLKLTSSITATARVRHFASAPLIEDGSQRSQATTLINLGAYWETGRWRMGIDLLNLFDAKDPDTSYWYASRLPGEPLNGIEDRHIHPVEPRQVRFSLQSRF